MAKGGQLWGIGYIVRLYWGARQSHSTVIQIRAREIQIQIRAREIQNWIQIQITAREIQNRIQIGRQGHSQVADEGRAMKGAGQVLWTEMGSKYWQTDGWMNGWMNDDLSNSRLNQEDFTINQHTGCAEVTNQL